MTKIDKLQDKLLRKPVDMKFDEIRAILKSHGFENVRTREATFSLQTIKM
ncbi:MAG: hypothetical protein NT166_09205 [Candidatus Aminicenantes bacterium]|jgi:virulence-associated protein VapD|nr:hypothetical protein [Candidatus Aminicenantes bacterium]